jgi:hypothetical protein
VKCKLVKHISAPTICNIILKEKNVKLKMQTHMMNLNEGIGDLNLNGIIGSDATT